MKICSFCEPNSWAVITLNEWTGYTYWWASFDLYAHAEAFVEYLEESVPGNESTWLLSRDELEIID